MRTCAAVIAAGLMAGGGAAAAQAGPVEARQPASAGATIKVSLGAHKFGAYTAADAVPARVGADGVGWYEPPDGVWYGPDSFDVGRDGTVWLLDEVNNRLLGWPEGRTRAPSLTVPVPRAVADFAVGPRGVFYLTTFRAGETPKVVAIGSGGQVRWRAELAEEMFNARLRIGPDGRLYEVMPGADTWIPLTDTAGSPLSEAGQRRLTLPYQPLPGGRRLLVTYADSHRQITVQVQDRTGAPVRTWKVSSATDLGPGHGVPAAVGADVVLPLMVSTETPSWKLENLALRLTATGAPVRLQLRYAIWGDEPITDQRVGPDAAYYHLRTSRSAGVTIARYGITPPAPAATPSHSGATVVPAPTTSAATSAPATGGVTAPPAVATSSAPAAISSSDQQPAGPRTWLAWTGGIALVLAVTAGAVLLIRHRHHPPPAPGLRGGHL